MEKSENLLRISVQIRLGSQLQSIEAALPPNPARADQLLPFLRAIVDSVVERAVQDSSFERKPVTCCKGCSACCQAQPVPVTPPEAYALLLLVESLPEPKQSEVRLRFAENRRKLLEEGLIDEFLSRRSEVTRERARQIASLYFALKLPCPFLDEGACSIYEDRPFVCRQYLVTSPAPLCDDPFGNEVAVVPMRLKPATATLQTMGEVLGEQQFTIPLALALQFAEEHRVELEQTFEAESLAKRWLERLFAQ